MTSQTLPLKDLTKRAMEILTRELGEIDTLRFVRQFTHGSGDYTAEREKMFEGLTLDQIASEIKKRRIVQ